jgi:hypothetical protein
MKNKLFLLAALMVLVLPLSSFKAESFKGNVKVAKHFTETEFGEFEYLGTVYGVYGTQRPIPLQE